MALPSYYKPSAAIAKTKIAPYTATVKQAADYLYGSWQSAKKSCPSVAPAYEQALLAFLQQHLFGPLTDAAAAAALQGPLSDVSYIAWQNVLSAADAKCQANKVSVKGDGDKYGPPRPGGDAHTEAGVVGGAWWLWLLGGAALFLLFGKKGKGKKK